MRTITLLIISLLALPLLAQQEQQMQMPMPPQSQQTPPPPPQKPDDMSGMDMQHAGHDMQSMNEEFANPAAAMEYKSFGSGTAWQARTSPEWMWMTKRRGWQLMAHGNLFLTFNHQGGPRGSGKLESENWLMFMEERDFSARGKLQFRQMFSAEPLTAPHPGFPELFQTGETYHGRPLVDHQHPHDVFGEIAVRYLLPLRQGITWSIYGGLAGEPALGPVAFLHRSSATEIPAAPISHHVQDSTHITFGVVTTGISFWKVKLEGSAFNGREPDEQRYDFDFGPLDSYSGRISFAPGENWAVQYSAGKLIRPEALEPGDIVRQTASVNYNRPFEDGNWATTLVWGRNHKTENATNQNSYLLESVVNFAMKNYAYTRLELVDKDELFPTGGGPAGFDSFRIGAYTLGGVRDLVQTDKWNVGLGADLTFYSKPGALDAYYGNNPVSVKVFLRIRPGRMKMR